MGFIGRAPIGRFRLSIEHKKKTLFRRFPRVTNTSPPFSRPSIISCFSLFVRLLLSFFLVVFFCVRVCVCVCEERRADKTRKQQGEDDPERKREAMDARSIISGLPVFLVRRVLELALVPGRLDSVLLSAAQRPLNVLSDIISGHVKPKKKQQRRI